MKYFFWTMVFMFVFMSLAFINRGVDNLDMTRERYKRALDAAANAAASFRTYDNNNSIEKNSYGFGTGLADKANIEINKDDSLIWFYRVFFMNLGLENNLEMQKELKKYIPMKAIVGYEKIMIADLEDNWIVEKNYDINYNGTSYRFTLSDQIMNLSTGVWRKDTDWGISAETRQMLVNKFIREEINGALMNRKNAESNIVYSIAIPYINTDYKESGVAGVSFIVLVEGMPLPTLNPWSPEDKKRFYAYAAGGTELYR